MRFKVACPEKLTAVIQTVKRSGCEVSWYWPNSKQKGVGTGFCILKDIDEWISNGGWTPIGKRLLLTLRREVK